ncbi:NAD(P)-binding protein [Dentipellis sp. KUC8613]|nr:NAD(P)-binding protein [Dentipellis sp. KUC8613]
MDVIYDVVSIIDFIDLSSAISLPWRGVRSCPRLHAIFASNHLTYASHREWYVCWYACLWFDCELPLFRPLARPPPTFLAAMKANPFVLITPATRGLSLALTRHFLQTTKLPVFATHRSGSASSVAADILKPLKDVESSRLTLLPLDLTDEGSIAAAADKLGTSLPEGHDSYLHTAFFTGGMLHPEKQPADIDIGALTETFQTNVISHLLLIKHFSRFLPSARTKQADSTETDTDTPKSKWVHVSARVGSIADNKRGGWYSYRASKAALNQVVKTFDVQLQMRGLPAMCIGVHPGTMKTGLSKDFWGSVSEEKLFSPEFAAGRLVEVVGGLEDGQRGRIWDWEGKEVPP